MTTRTPGKSRMASLFAAAMAFAGYPIEVLRRRNPPKLPRNRDDYDAVVTAEIKRRRKNAKRLHNQKKGNTK